eukprot:1154161-Pelagomonas_calceolata.AAC.3
MTSPHWGSADSTSSTARQACKRPEMVQERKIASMIMRQKKNREHKHFETAIGPTLLGSSPLKTQPRVTSQEALGIVHTNGMTEIQCYLHITDWTCGRAVSKLFQTICQPQTHRKLQPDGKVHQQQWLQCGGWVSAGEATVFLASSAGDLDGHYGKKF